MNRSLVKVLSALLLPSAAAFAACGVPGESSTDGNSAIDDPPSAAAGPVPDGLPGALLASRSGVRRMTLHELESTIARHLFETVSAKEMLPADIRSPFDNDYTTQAISDALVRPLEVLSEQISSRLMKDVVRRDKVVGCVPNGVDDAKCFESFVTHFGRLMLRRPLEAEEVTSYVGAQAKANGDFYGGVDIVVRAMLQDPEFLYRIEVGTPVPGQPALVRLSDFEIASRLSFLMLGRGPDDALLDQAAAGKLHAPQQVRNAAADLLALPGGKAQVQRFFQLWMNYENPTQEKKLADAMRAETDALVGKVVIDDKRPWQDLFRSTETFVDDSMATIYGLPLPGSQATWVSYGATGRKGILSHGSLLAVGAKFGDTSPTQRGIWVRKQLLCQTITPPPPGVPVTLPPLKEGDKACKKERYKVHAAPACVGCHALSDAVGFGLEQYDDKGKFRTTDNGRPDCLVDGEGEFKGGGTFNGPAALGDLLLKTGELSTCAVTQMQRFVGGRTLLDADDNASAKAISALQPGDFKLTDMVLNFVSSESFLHRKSIP